MKTRDSLVDQIVRSLLIVELLTRDFSIRILQILIILGGCSDRHQVYWVQESYHWYCHVVAHIIRVKVASCTCTSVFGNRDRSAQL